MVNVLHLTIKRRWFNEILRGVKTLEYGANKPYWNRRLDGKHFDEIRFRNGYRRDSPFMRVQILRINKGVDGYIIELGKVLECTLGEGNDENFWCQTWGSEPK